MIKTSLIIALSIVLFLGCENQDDESNYLDLGGDIFFSIVTDTLIDGQWTGELSLLIATVDEWSCMNYLIETDMDLIATALKIDILGVTLPDGVCLTAFGPATTKYNIVRLGSDFELEISHGSQTDEYHVTIADSAIVLPKSASFSEYRTFNHQDL
jgi:hypothetical protein